MTDRFPPQQSGGQGSSGSSLRDSLLKARIAKLPHLPAIAPNRQEAGASSLSNLNEDQDEKVGDSLGSLSMPKPTKSSSRLRSVHANIQDEYSPISADDCFSEALEVDVDEEDLSEQRSDTADVRPTQLSGDQAASEPRSSGRKTTFRVYYTPPKRTAKASKPFSATATASVTPSDKPPTVSLSSLQQNQEEDDDEEDESTPTIFLLHHGAGYSALSFALVAKSITQQTKGKAGVLAYDCRGHGKTAHPNDASSSKLSLDRLTKDGLAILAKMFPPDAKQPNLVLVGHSMGGAVIVSMAHALANSAKSSTTSKPRVAGVAVLDVVEGTAIAALPSMRTIIAQLPKGFDSIPEAIQWHIDSGTIVNPQSARRSVPSLLRPNENVTNSAKPTVEEEPMEEMISEVGAQDTEKVERPASSFQFVWRHDLLATEPYWRGWFEGLSDSFLKVKCARLLLLAGTDRLDKELMIGQMQGKYQLVVFPDVGHSLQEDAPQRTAQTLVEFWRRNEMVDVKTIKSLRKVGDS
ncbi:alpha/beta-hydrolase [Meira miltonrushii]|uniref:Protein phosphatase methylesterase 1 n=1 Tax=Meira miltonrushii TaxID=1280837 RepID=A0A316VFQ0_9BASI|nr:alpha/beta-hydrolase [Meira miltonrushii]PWN36412.1 alpha/beta-hydrolase [Meira miltonrushii]